MSNYRVVKVIFADKTQKYAAQKKYTSELVTWKWLIFPFREKEVTWGNLFKVSEGTDNLVPCFYNTKEEAWQRIRKQEMDKKLDCPTSDYQITDEYYA